MQAHDACRPGTQAGAPPPVPEVVAPGPVLVAEPCPPEPLEPEPIAPWPHPARPAPTTAARNPAVRVACMSTSRPRGRRVVHGSPPRTRRELRVHRGPPE